MVYFNQEKVMDEKIDTIKIIRLKLSLIEVLHDRENQVIVIIGMIGP